MKFQLVSGDFEKKKHDCLVIGIYEKGELTPAVKKLDKTSGGYLTKLIKQGDITGSLGSTLWLYDVPHLNTARVLIVGCGKQSDLSPRNFRNILACSVKALSASKVKHALTFLTELSVAKHDAAWHIKQATEVAEDALYRFDTYKSKPAAKSTLQQLDFYVNDKAKLKSCETAFKQGLAVASGMAFTKNLANQPSNVCTPSYLALQAKDLAKQHKSIKVKVLEESDMKKLGMGAFLAVAQGSVEDAKLICIEYYGASKTKAPVALVGKGITFDTGGLSLKPADSMVSMKYDMCGAATVLGVMKAAAELKLPINIVGILAAAENMPSGNATKPEDIVTTMSGQTVEILNTDAEGRLVLGDALTYVGRYKPDVVIDIATLTGAVVIALGTHVSAVVGNNEPLIQELISAGTESHDRVWQLPLWEEYQDQLKSPFADMANIGGRSAGAITASCFLSRFTKDYKWAHLDVAGTAAMMMGGADRYATGRPVPLLMQFLLNRC